MPGAREDDSAGATSPPEESMFAAKSVPPEEKPSGLARPATDKTSRERRLLTEPKGVMPLEEGSKEQTDEVGEAIANNPSLM